MKCSGKGQKCMRDDDEGQEVGNRFMNATIDIILLKGQY